METKIQKNVWQISMVAAPLLIAIAQFFWQNGRLTPTAGWIQVLGFAFWIVAFQGMFFLLKDKMPFYHAFGFLIAAFACIGGAGFGFDGIYTHAMGYTNTVDVNTMHTEIGLPLQVSLFLPGILFPLSLLVLGIQLIRSQSVVTWVGILLIVAAVGFPLSRIPRIDWLAHLDNLLLVFSHLAIIVGRKS